MNWYKQGYNPDEGEIAILQELENKNQQIMQSKIKSIQGSGTWENANGVDLGNGKKGFFKFEYTFEDGTVLMANSKSSPPPFKVGDVAEYEVKREHPEHGKSGTVKRPQDNNRSGYSGGNRGSYKDNTESIVLQVCAKIASDQFVAHGVHFASPQDISDYAVELAKLLLQTTKELKGE